MSCGCSGAASGAGVVQEDQPQLMAYQLPNETTECFMQRVGGDPIPPTAELPPDHIQTLFIHVDCVMKTDTTFIMTPPSVSIKKVKWVLVLKDDQGEIVQPSDLGLVYNESVTDDKGNLTATLKGTILDAYEKKTLHAHMKALATEDIPDLSVHTNDIVDEKEYEFVPKKCDPNDLKFINPNPGSRLTSPFGPRNCTGCSPNHKGIDLASHGKNDIIAAADGVVSYADNKQSGYGNLVIIDHKDANGGILASTAYGHLSAIFVNVGDQVAAGSKIGHEGNTGHSGGPHLHFEIRMHGRKGSEVDPWPLINGEIIVDAGVGTNADPSVTSDAAPTKTVQKDKGLTKEKIEASTKCKSQGSAYTPAAASDAGPLKSVKGCGKCAATCVPDGWTPPRKSVVAQQIVDTLNSKGITNFEDQLFFICTALVESTFCQYVKNCTSSAIGIFQMLNGTAAENFNKVGIAPTCENRCNVGYATIAMIPFFQMMLGRWNSYKAGSSRFTDVRLADLTRNEFLYEVHGQGPSGIYRGTNGFIGFRQNYAKSRFLWNLPDIASVIAAIDAKS